MNDRRPHNKGETLAETVIALMILSIGITFSGTILATSLKNVSSSKNRVIAVNIAREGLEAVRNIRDTNWLKFSGNRRDCWHHLPGPLPDSCDGSTPIPTGEFIVYKDKNQRWRLRVREQVREFDSSRLFLMDMDPNFDTDGDRNAVNDRDIYNHELTADRSPLGGGEDPLGYERAEQSLFSRVIMIDYLNNENLTPAEMGGDFNRMAVTSVVTWIVGGQSFSAELKTRLTDYLGRDNLDS